MWIRPDSPGPLDLQLKGRVGRGRQRLALCSSLLSRMRAILLRVFGVGSRRQKVGIAQPRATRGSRSKPPTNSTSIPSRFPSGSSGTGSTAARSPESVPPSPPNCEPHTVASASFALPLAERSRRTRRPRWNPRGPGVYPPPATGGRTAEAESSVRAGQVCSRTSPSPGGTRKSGQRRVCRGHDRATPAG